jgi:LmbE family N-acetylglucosaminyl deacetylase
MKVLIISPHPDDMEIWMGGTAAKLVDEGNEVRSIILTDGHRSPRSFECSDEEMVKIRKQEGSEAHKILGITDFEYFSLPNAENEQIVKNILTEELAKELDVIYMPALDDMHPTHSLVAKYVMQIVEENKLNPDIFTYDGWNFLHHPLIFVDIEKYINRKVAGKCE